VRHVFKAAVFDLDHWLCDYGASVDVGITGAGQVGREKLVDRPAG
jgi:hypothetical protein